MAISSLYYICIVYIILYFFPARIFSWGMVIDKSYDSACSRFILIFQVVVNQDKASKQIASLRAEIQSLQLELMEYKQVRLIVNTSLEAMTHCKNIAYFLFGCLAFSFLCVRQYIPIMKNNTLIY